MRVGVFGDSYAHPYHVFSNVLRRFVPDTQIKGNIYHEFKYKFNVPWMYMLEAQSDIEFVNHAGAGTDVFYSFAQFLQNHTTYDKVIFVVTSFHRYSYPLVSIRNSDVDDWICFTATNHKRDNIKRCAISDYLTHVVAHDGSREQAGQRSMLAYIKQIRPDVKFIAAFDNDLPVDNLIEDIFPIEGNALIDITVKEEQDVDMNNNKLYDIRANHMTETNNRIFASKILDFVNDDKQWLKFDINDFKFNADKFLYTKQEILEIATKEGLLK